MTTTSNQILRLGIRFRSRLPTRLANTAPMPARVVHGANDG